MILKAVNWGHLNKIMSNALERSQLGTQCKYQVIWSWKESIGYILIKIGQMVLKVNWVHNTKFRSYGLWKESNGLERSQFGTQCKNQVTWSWKESIRYTLIKIGTPCKNQVIWSWKESIGYTLIKLGTQHKNHVTWSWKE